jgi:DNA-binding NtrC family response regulator
LTPAAEQILCEYVWPGNVRELKNVTERLVVRALAGAVTPDDLPEEIRIGPRPAKENGGATESTANAVAALAAPPGPAIVDVLWRRLLEGETFWSAVYEPFKSHDLTRADLRALVDRGLTETRGSYRKLLALFQMPAGDYKRFLAFLYQFNGNLPVQRYRTGRASDRDHDANRGAARDDRAAG